MLSSVVWSCLFYSLSQSCVAPSAAVSQLFEEVVYSRWIVCCCMHVSLSLLALIICRTKPWAEGSAGSPTLIWRVHVCVFMYCSPLVLRSCFAANDPAKHLNDKEHKLPAVLWATANRLASQTQKTLGKKLEKKRKHTASKKKKKNSRGDVAVLKGSEESSHCSDLGSLMSTEMGTNAGWEQLAKSECVCLSFTSNFSLKPVSGSRGPLIRTSAVFALLSKCCHLVGPLCDLAAHTEKPSWFTSFEVYHFHISIIILHGQLFIQL